MENLSREIIVYKLNPQFSNSNLGYLRAVMEKTDNDYIPLDAENFCPSGKVFVTTEYEDLDRKFKEFELFKITATETQYKSNDLGIERNCNYVTKGTSATPLKNRDLLELIPVRELPDVNTMVINISYKPSTSYIYIQDSNNCYGPFKWENIDDPEMIQLKKIDSPIPGRSPLQGSIFTAKIDDLSSHIVKCNLNDYSRSYFKDLTSLHNDTKLTSMEFSSDTDIINYFLKLSKEISFNNKKMDLTTLDATIKKQPKISNNKNVLEKLNRLHDIFNEHTNSQKEIIESFEKFFKSDSGDKFIKKYIETNEETYLNELKYEYRAQLESEFRSRNEEISELKNRIELNKQELVDIGKRIEEANRHKLDLNSVNDIKTNNDLTNEISQKQNKLAQLNKELETLQEKYSTLKELDKIKIQLEETKKEYRYEVARQSDLEKETKKLEKLYREEEDELRAKLFALKPFVEAINGNISSTLKAKDLDIALQTHSLELNHQENATKILDYVEFKLREKDRNLSKTDIINIIVNLQQSFICFLAGLPGGGKTTLAKILGQIYGIYEKRFLNVPVARGWTAQKDLIGFMNPISNKFQPSSTGLYEFLLALNEEKNNGGSNPLSLVLLDEANLSPIEHYWSAFMGISDAKKDKILRLGEDKLLIPESLRFISTINYDNTTEFLSPRLIDRAPIIVLDANSNEDESYLENEKYQNDIEMPLDYEVMEHYFGNIEKTPELSENEKKIYKDVEKILGDRNPDLGKSIHISHRKENAIRQYCNKSRPLMRLFSTDNELLAIDYAILQMILPLVRGHGKNFQNRLLQLKQILSEHELERSFNYLDEIIINGNADLHTYDFFCW